MVGRQAKHSSQTASALYSLGMRSLTTLVGLFLLLAFTSHSALTAVVVDGEAAARLKTDPSDVLDPPEDEELVEGVGEQEALDESDEDDESEGVLIPAKSRRPIRVRCFYSRRYKKVICLLVHA